MTNVSGKTIPKLTAVLLAFVLLSLAVIPVLPTSHGLSGISFNQSTDLVNSIGFYTVIFTIGITHSVNAINVTFPSGAFVTFTVSGARLVQAFGISGAATISSISGPNIIVSFATQTLTAGHIVGLEFVNIKNPSKAATSFTGKVETKLGTAIVEGPTSSAAFAIRQLAGADISSLSSLSVKSVSASTSLLVSGGPSLTAAGISVPTGKAVTLAGTTTLTVGGAITANGGIKGPTSGALTIAAASGQTLVLTGSNFGVSSTGAITGASLSIGTGAITAGSLLLSGAITGATSINTITVPTGGGTFITTANIASNAVKSVAATGPGLTASPTTGNVMVTMSTTPSGFTSIGVGNLVLSASTLSAPSSDLTLSSVDGTVMVGDGAGFPFVVIGSAGAPTPGWFTSSGGFFAAGGLFQVQPTGNVFVSKSISVSLSETIGGSLSVSGDLFVSTNFHVDPSGNLFDHSLNVYPPGSTTASFSVDSSGNVFAAGTLTAANGAFTADTSGNVKTFNLFAQSLTVTAALSAANGLFQVSAGGLITTPSVSIDSFVGGALPFTNANSASAVTSTVPTSVNRDTAAIVYVTVDVQDQSNNNWEIIVQLTTSYPAGVVIQPESVHAFYLAATSENAVTYEFMVTGITAGSTGSFISTLGTCSVGLDCGVGSFSSGVHIFDNYVSVVWLPTF